MTPPVTNGGAIDELSATTVLPGYSLGKCLKSGDYLSTFRGTRLSDGSSVILKLTKAHAPTNLVARLEREYEVTRALNESGAVQPLALEATLEGYALIFHDGGDVSLDDYMRGTALPLERFFEFALQIVEILARVHEKNVVHKDIKPGNILVAPDTLVVQITDFGIATTLAREAVSNRAPNELEASLAYIAPEQTGRMNRSIDSRSDFYSLGVSFYEMLTGELPFTSTDPAELIHQHIARIPESPGTLNQEIPTALSAIVLKLLSKEPEDRYQSALGLLRDLHTIRLSPESTAEQFQPGKHDVLGRLLLPEKLYGRDTELEALVSAVEATASGRARLLTVAGHSGIGKSALVKEVMRPIAGRQGHFISGKFDQLNRNIPYSAIVQAFEELAPKMLAESRSRVEQWRNAILDALGDNAQVIVDIIPGFELLLGKQTPVVRLGPGEFQNRFNLMFRRFMRAIATIDHPLVIFLDDLQWADSASISLIQVLLSDPDISNLLLVAAYRDNEVGPGHPLPMMFGELEDTGTPVESIYMEHLDQASTEKLITDSLQMPGTELKNLSALVFNKTQGNPFFVRQFLRTLNERHLLNFDTDALQWRWDIGRIEAEQITDNVVDLVAARIYRLSHESQQLVHLGACIGNLFDLKTLAMTSNRSASEVATGLSNALQQEIIVPVGENYKYVSQSMETNSDSEDVWYRFPHDRLHQAAYSTIPEDQRAAMHTRVGRLILSQSNENQIEDRLFEIVNHLNHTDLAHTSQTELNELAHLNLRAGMKAKSSTAYEAALRYLDTGIALLGSSGWKEQEQHTFELHVEQLETTYMSGQFAQAEALSHKLLERSLGTLDEVRVRELLITNYTSRLEYRKAILASVQALALLGEHVPNSPSQSQLLMEYLRARVALRGTEPARLIDLPLMEDPYTLAAMRILLAACAPAYFEDPNMMPYLALRMIRLSVKNGNAGASAFGYVMYGGMLCGVFKDMPRGLAYGDLALAVVEKTNAQDIKGQVLQAYGGFVAHWNRRVSDSLPIFMDAASACLKAGGLEFHGYSRYSHLSYAFMGGLPLDQVWTLIDAHHDAVLVHKHEKTQFIMQMMREAVRELRGSDVSPRPADEPEFGESNQWEIWAKRDKQALTYYHGYKLLICYMNRDYQACLESISIIREHYHTVLGMLFSPYYDYFEALTLTGMLPSLSGMKRAQAVRRVKTIRNSLASYSRHAPENHQHRYLLVSAELLRASGKDLEAERAYQDGAKLAHRNGSLLDEALAYELLGEFHLEQGRQVVARIFLSEARHAFSRWGGRAWIERLERQHKEVLGSDTEQFQVEGLKHKVEAEGSGHNIDIATITQAARAISEKIMLDDVLRVVLHAAIVNAGAERGVLLLSHGDEPLVKAIATSDSEELILHSIPLAETDQVPGSIINYVASSQKSIVLDDALADTTFSTDPYVTRHQVRSIICLPLIEKGMMIGFLYLENTLVHGAFTQSRVLTLEVLAAQAAISLENARLYREVSDHAKELEEKVRERTSELEDAYDTLRDIFGKYVPRRVAEELVASKGSLKPTKTTATILYSDIEGFTSIAEKIPPEQVVDMLNEYFPAVIEHIERNGGIVNQFQGDAMLVTFNVPVADAEHAQKAVQTAIAIQAATAGRTFAGIPIRTRIGINTGEVFAGNVGSGERTNYTVHGDAVNLAARIEQLNKEYGTGVLVSGNTVKLLADTSDLFPVGEVSIRGKTDMVMLYRTALDKSESNEEHLACRFRELWGRCATGTDGELIWREIRHRYSQPHRFYHSLMHLEHCFDQLDAVRHLIDEPDSTELALWFHDLIYDIDSTDNEAASAERFADLANGAIPEPIVTKVVEFILVSTHLEETVPEQAHVMLDIDLSSMGLPWDTYLSDSQALRNEALGTPDAEHYIKQLRFLEVLLARDHIFHTDFFRDRLEQQARENISRYCEYIRSLDIVGLALGSRR